VKVPAAGAPHPEPSAPGGALGRLEAAVEALEGLVVDVHLSPTRAQLRASEVDAVGAGDTGQQRRVQRT